MPKRMRDLPVEYVLHQRSLAQAIGERLRVRRMECELTQEQLRARVELEQVAISRTQYSRIENGDILPNAAQLQALCLILEVSYAWLIDGVAQD